MKVEAVYSSETSTRLNGVTPKMTVLSMDNVIYTYPEEF
jgi:hypothetical protein